MGGRGGRDGGALSSASPLPTLELQGVGPVPIETEGWGWGWGGGVSSVAVAQDASTNILHFNTAPPVSLLLVCSLQEAEALAKKEQQ